MKAIALSWRMVALLASRALPSASSPPIQAASRRWYHAPAAPALIATTAAVTSRENERIEMKFMPKMLPQSAGSA